MTDITDELLALSAGLSAKREPWQKHASVPTVRKPKPCGPKPVIVRGEKYKARKKWKT